LISSSPAQRPSWALIQRPDRGRPAFQGWWAPVALCSIKRRWGLGHKSRGSPSAATPHCPNPKPISIGAQPAAGSSATGPSSPLPLYRDTPDRRTSPTRRRTHHRLHDGLLFQDRWLETPNPLISSLFDVLLVLSQMKAMYPLDLRLILKFSTMVSESGCLLL
jgi:hypothetical protein